MGSKVYHMIVRMPTCKVCGRRDLERFYACSLEGYALCPDCYQIRFHSEDGQAESDEMKPGGRGQPAVSLIESARDLDGS